MIFVGIFLAIIALTMFWREPSGCVDKHLEFSPPRYLFGAIFGTIGIGLCFTGHPVVMFIGFLMIAGGYALQNREEWEYNRDPE